MTRFARAKGSKSSNLKEPDDSTPWEVMKEQMQQAKKESEDNKNREVAENQRIENYSNFLKEQKVQKRKATWCDFPETENNKKAKEQKPEQNKSKKNKNKSKKVEESQTHISHEANVQETNKSDVVDKVSNKKKKKKNKMKNKSEGVTHEANKNKDETTLNKDEIKNIEQTENKEEKVKNKKKNKQAPVDVSKTVSTESESRDLHQPNKQNIGQKKKNKKNRGDKPTRRKEINDRSFQLIINSKEVELIRFDGFPIMKKDAERLSELKNNMIKKGIPKTEVNRTIKLERRRAEKALARLKRDVCYNCRKGGHNLSDCPELKSNIPGVGAADGICFKCGSTEHRQFECKVQKDKEFRFASCFICKEQGHIARQCPDNPKGLYPNGGCCKLCGDVTHLRKDCPTVQPQKEGTSIKLQTFDTGSNIEDIDLQPKAISEEAPKKPKKIKF